jgi:hypothetical protein
MIYDHIWRENMKRINKADSGYFELESRGNYEYIKVQRNMYAEGSFKDPSLHRFLNNITKEVYVMTMKDMAAYSLERQWHRGSWCGTQLVKRVGSQRSIITYLGKVA